ncbi:MAG: hypothetical protein JKX73_03745 [Flavobacteriales bacterium]|nr:hypothetical protein [Flavobacteriales bacterium]
MADIYYKMKGRFICFLLIVAAFSFVLQMSSCTIGYRKLTMHKIRNDTTWVLYQNLPNDVADTITKIYDKYLRENRGLSFPTYNFPELVSLDSTIIAEIIKYQSFDSEKLRLPFGYFFRFGRKKYFIPYGEQRINPPFVYLNERFYFPGKLLVPYDEILNVHDPDYYKVEVKGRYYIVYKMKGKSP